MIKTLADLKRDAKSGKLEGRMLIRCGEENTSEKLKGWRKIVDANSVGITFLNNEGKKSELRIEKASLVEYTQDKLIIYYPMLRDLNEEELKVMQEWKTITDTEEYKRRSEIDLHTDGSSTFYQKKSFFQNKDYEYLLGYEFSKGKKYDFNTKKVRDMSLKGDIEMLYELRINN